MKNFAPVRPTLRQLQYFVAVAEHGAFGVAADALAVTQPSLSKQLATMEIELGVTLFERTSRSVKLTKIGTSLLPRAKMILHDVKNFQAAARTDIGLFGNRLSIGVLPSVGAYFMPSANRLLHGLYPDLRLVVEEGSTEELLKLLSDGKLDVVIGSPTNDPQYLSTELFVETLWACAATDDPLSKKTDSILLEELSNKPLLSLRSGFQLTEIVERLAKVSGTYVSREYQGASLDAVRQMAVMGAGVAILPSLYALAEAVRDPEFTIRRIEHTDAKHPVSLIWRRSSTMEADCLQLAEHLITVKQEIRAARPERFR